MIARPSLYMTSDARIMMNKTVHKEIRSCVEGFGAAAGI